MGRVISQSNYDNFLPSKPSSGRSLLRMLWNPFFEIYISGFSHAFISNNVCEARSFRKQYAQAAIQGQAQHLALVHIITPVSISSPASSNVRKGCGQWKSLMDGGNN